MNLLSYFWSNITPYVPQSSRKEARIKTRHLTRAGKEVEAVLLGRGWVSTKAVAVALGRSPQAAYSTLHHILLRDKYVEERPVPGWHRRATPVEWLWIG